MQIRLHVGPDGALTDRKGRNLGKLQSLTLDIDLDKAVDRGAIGQEGVRPVGGVTEERLQAVDVGSTNAVVARETDEQPRLDGTDNRRALIDHWAHIFGKKAVYSPARMRAAERAFKEEPDLDRLLTALRGFKRYRIDKPGSEEFTQIFGTYRGTGDLPSRIEWMVGLAEPDERTLVPWPVPSAGREMLKERLRHLEEWLRSGDESKRVRGELAQQWFRDTFRREARMEGEVLVWYFPSAPFVSHRETVTDAEGFGP